MPSLISCIVPVYNGERYVKEALDNILAQTYQSVEIIVADDGSTDGTAKVVADYGEKAHYLWQPNAGAPTARNLGVRAAQGEFLAFLDADNLWHSEKLMRQMARFEARPELDISVTHLQNFWIPELTEEAKRFRGHRLSQAVPGYVTQTLLARRALFETVGWFNITARVGDSIDWFLRAAEQGAVMELIPDVLVYRRMHQANLSMELGSRRMTSAMNDALLKVVKASLDRRRRDRGTPVTYDFPTSDWRKTV